MRIEARWIAIAALAAGVAAGGWACGGAAGSGDAGADDAAGDATDPFPDATEIVIVSVRAVAVTDTTAIVSWYTYVPATSQVDWGVDDAYGSSSTLDAAMVQDHRVAIAGLSPDTEYHYSARSGTPDLGEGRSEDHTFRTLPAGCPTGDAFHVDAAAPAGGDGLAEATAWITPADADWAAIGQGDCLILHEGSYRDGLSVRGSGAEGDPIVVRPSGPVVLLGGISVDEGVHDVEIRGFEVTHDDPAMRGEGIALDGDRITLTECYLHHASGVYSGGAGNLVANNVVWFVEGVALTVAGSDSAIEDNDASHSTCMFAGDADASRFFGDRNAIRGNFFHDVLDEDSPGCNPHCDCFQTYSVNPGESAHDITIEGNTCFNICGQMFMGEGIPAEDTHSRITFRGNVFERVGAIAMNAGGITEMTLDHNTWVDSGLGAIAFSDCAGCSVTSNLFYRNPYTYGCEACAVDWNWIWPWDCHMDSFDEPDGTYGTDPLLEDPVNHGFGPVPGSPACAAGESGTHVGAIACAPETACSDRDGDGWGRVASALCAGAGADSAPDCDDENPAAFPGHAEDCDGEDNDCDALVDEDCADPVPVIELGFDGSIEDGAASGLDVEWVGTPSYAPEGAGQAALFDGSGDGPYVVIADDPALCGMGLLTISVRARKASAEGGTILNKHVYYNLGVGADSVDAYVQTDPTGGIDLDVYGMAGIDDTDWHLYEIMYDSRTGEASLSVDGTVAATGTGEGFVRWDPCDPRDLYVGKDPWGATFDGMIDDVVIRDGIAGG